MQNRRMLSLGLFLLSVTASTLAQDLVAVAPQAAKVEYEDARIRVVRLKLAANEVLPMHDRPARIVVPLTVNDVRTTRPDGTSAPVKAEAGKAAWSEPAKRSVQNLAMPLENIIVELKQASGPASPLARAPEPSPADYLKDRYHHWLFENQYVRVFDVRIPPGATTEFHLHALDSVFVIVSSGRTAAQLQGKDWAAPEDEVAGSVEFSPDANGPRTHRVRNLGKAEFHAVVVQLLR
jgi:quercetin dioxygenase-like cupin family protein